MPRYKLTIEYDGTEYCGWQRQADQPSVQQTLEEAIEKFCGEDVRTQVAGRTDSGVHALGQVAHVDLQKKWDPFRVAEAINYHLKPHPIAILDAEQVNESFEARFSATGRHYEYRILNRRARPALEINRVWWQVKPLDADVMHHAAQALVGQHDFTSFRAAECQAKSPVKTLTSIAVRREFDHIVLTVSGRSFLHHQVRSIMGSLKLVGEGKWKQGEIADVLAARDRRRCGAMAPAAGLYLVSVDY